MCDRVKTNKEETVKVNSGVKSGEVGGTEQGEIRIVPS